MKNKVILLCLAFTFVLINSYADTITLKSGEQIEGKILDRTGDSVKIDFQGVELTYFLDQIDKVNGEQVASLALATSPNISQEVTAEPPQKELTVTPPTGPKPLDTLETVKEVKKETISSNRDKDLVPLQAQEQSKPLSKPDANNPKLGKVNTAVAMGVALFMVVIFILFYIYSVLCFQFIAQKTNNGPVWLAWIPIANLFLMCKIASIRYWWLLLILLSFIPLIGLLINIGFFGFVWYKIALARNKPGWLGILAIIPVANLFIMGYLAFSN